MFRHFYKPLSKSLPLHQVARSRRTRLYHRIVHICDLMIPIQPRQRAHLVKKFKFLLTILQASIFKPDRPTVKMLYSGITGIVQPVGTKIRVNCPIIIPGSTVSSLFSLSIVITLFSGIGTWCHPDLSVLLGEIDLHAGIAVHIFFLELSCFHFRT